jgi:hypothetical protein
MYKPKLIIISQSKILKNEINELDSNNTIHLIKIEEKDKIKIIIKNLNNKMIYEVKLNNEDISFSSGIINNNECTISIE